MYPNRGKENITISVDVANTYPGTNVFFFHLQQYLMMLMASESCVYGHRFQNLSNALDRRESMSSRLCCPLSPLIKGEAEAEVSRLSRESQLSATQA